MKKRIGLLVGMFVVATLLSALVLAQHAPTPPQGPQGPQGPTPPRPMDPLADAIFPPEMIMGHIRELGLTDEQKSLIRSEIQKTTTRYNELQWQLQDAFEVLHDIMKSDTVNEQQALAQLDKVLDAEREIKRLHIGLAIRIKKSLTPDQRAKLHAMRGIPGGPVGPPGPGPGPAPRPDDEDGAQPSPSLP